MSGVFKAIGKVFKKVVKVVKKIAPFALAAAAVVFTGGAALGVLPTFASAMGGLVGSLGISGALAPILTGALTNAGFGAAVGGLLGGKKGMTAGLITGGLLGGLGGIGGAAPVAAGVSPASNAISTASNLFGAPVGGASPVSWAGAAGAAPAAAGATAAAGAGGGIVNGLLSNPMLLSTAVQGLGAGLTASGQVKAGREEAARQAANYGIQDGLLHAINRTGGTPNAQEIAEGATYDPMAEAGQWVYDAQQGKLVRRLPQGSMQMAA